VPYRGAVFTQRQSFAYGYAVFFTLFILVSLLYLKPVSFFFNKDLFHEPFCIPPENILLFSGFRLHL
jgi:hypothetical protein